ncbi:hypothetical protein EP331_13670 [bacterium]|nr:MAG: hypothetical protein EP331_13670 [bacterium]
MSVLDLHKVQAISKGNSAIETQLFKRFDVLVDECLAKIDPFITVENSKAQSMMVHKLKPNVELLCSAPFHELTGFLNEQLKHNTVDEKLNGSFEQLISYLIDLKSELTAQLSA